MSNNNSIPKLIFQTWKSKTDLPENFAAWQKSLKDVNPEFAYRIWDDKDNRAFIAKNFAWFLETYDSYPSEIFRADAVRYFFLYKFGGVYVDMDTECLKPLDPLLEVSDVVLGRMGTNAAFDHSIPNAIMMSKPRQEFWLLVMSLMLSQVGKHDQPEYVTGPVVLKTAHDLYTTQYREDVVQNRLANIRVRMSEDNLASEERTALGILPGFVLYPIDWSDRVHDHFVRRPIIEKQQMLSKEDANALFPHSTLVTYWAHSWDPQ